MEGAMGVTHPTMDLSVVIVNWNSGAHLGRLLASLSPLKEELQEIWVVDNASSDSSLGGFQSYPAVQILALKENQGFAGGANQGISRSSSDFIFLLNPDIEVVPESVKQLYQEMVNRPLAGIVCGSLMDPAGRPQSRFQIRSLPTWKTVLSDVLFIDELKQWLGRGLDRSQSMGRDGCAADGTSSGQAQRLESQQPAAAAWFLRKEAWKDLGGFDTRFYPAWFEDVDFCRRLQDSQWEVFYFSHLPLIHQGGLALEHLSYSTFIGIFYRNLLRYLKKHHPYSYPLLWLPVQGGMWARRLFVRR
ncbi:glycosyltransferase family 2 protein [Acidobacteria bacterium AH-259-D05]|nr:glycosyltransferase family 2 protein [Acidobacteria bacterium AH-259-D05]